MTRALLLAAVLVGGCGDQRALDVAMKCDQVLSECVSTLADCRGYHPIATQYAAMVWTPTPEAQP